MNHLGTVTLETDRLKLRQFIIEDAQDMFNNWAKDEEVTKYLTWPAHKNVDDSQKYIELLTDEYKKLCSYDWGIELKEIKQVIGSMGAVRINDELNIVHIGYCIGKRWWNQGFTSEAFSAVIKFMMDNVKVNRIESRHDPRNINSGKVMQKCGLIYEGTLRESDINNQGICDASWYGLIRKDYYSLNHN